MSYLGLLRQSARDNKSIVCMGLDPVPEALPRSNEGLSEKIADYLDRIFKMMKQEKAFPAAFKPNEGFYSKHDSAYCGNFIGSFILSSLFPYIREKFFPGIPLILDNKRGDIATSSANYAEEGFSGWRADAVTVHPYMGTDSVMPFAEHCKNGKGVYILNRTSNKGAKDFQDLQVIIEGEKTMPLYMAVAAKIAEWAAENPGVGAVVGATYPDELSRIAEFYVKSGAEVPLLIPGVGGQGGSAKEVVQRLKDAGYDLSIVRINSSSGLTHPWKTFDKAPKTLAECAKRCIEELKKLNEEIGYCP